jgi:hypothetical protein
MANCSNPKFIDTADVNYFGFNTVFNPYNKSMTFDISGITTFKTDGEDNITSIVFEVTDPNLNEYTADINPSLGEEEVTITGLEQGELYFGQYHIKATLTQPATSDEDEQTFVIEFDVNVCYDPKLNNKNLAVGCALIEVNCSTAKMVIKEGANMKFAGKQISSITTLGTINYPIDPETSAPFLAPVQFTYTPYQLSLAKSITGLYSIVLVTTAYYDLGCNCLLAIEYRSNVNKYVLCGNGMCEITCCWTESIDIIKKGGSKGSQMAELVAEAIPYYISAQLLADCGKNNDFYVKKVKEILNCDCKCESKSLLIQPNPITFGASNLIPSCGTTITEDENGDYVFHSFVYQVAPADGEDKISFETVQINECTKVTYATIHCDKIERCIYNILATDIDILNQWKILFGIGDCCTDVTITNTPTLLSLNTLSDDFATLEDTYFVKNDIITGVQYQDDTQIVGGTLQVIKYFDQIIQQQGILNTAGGTITLPCQVCGESISNLSGYKLTTEATTTCGCGNNTNCDLNTPQVDYSERYGSAYRFNPQINLPPYITYTQLIDGNPYTMYKIYFGDFDTDGTYSCVRALTIKVDNLGVASIFETRTIIGANFGSGISEPTTNNTWGNEVNVNRPSSINLDMTEIVNGEPVLYFTTFGGYVCRAVKERNSECDERANWKLYVLLDTGNSLYGMKKWEVDENGNQTFIFNNNTTSGLYLFNFDNTGTKNDSSNWTTTNLNITCAGANSNFQVKLTKKWIFTLEEYKIKIVIYSGTTALAQLQNATNYDNYDIVNNAPILATAYTDGFGSVATVAQPTWMNMMLDGTDEVYFFGNADSDITNSYIKQSYIRFMTYRGGDPTLQDSFTFSTDIVANNNSILADGTWNPSVSSNANGASQGMVEIPDVGWLSMFINGVKIFDFDAHENQVFSGQATASGNLAETDLMDTQFSYELTNCESGSDE